MEPISKERLEQLRAAGATQYELGKLARLQSQVMQAMQALGEESSIAARKNLEDAERVFGEFLADIEAKYAPGASGSGECFANRREAWQWLRDNGLEMGESTFYRQVGKPGFPALLPGKRLSKWECSEFLRQQQMAGAAAPQGGVHSTDDLLQRKLVADTEKAEADAGIAKSKAADLARKTDKYWMPRLDAYAMCAALVGRLIDAALHQIRHRQIELVAACRGEEERAPELYEAIARAFAAARNEVAGQRLEETLEESDEDHQPAD